MTTAGRKENAVRIDRAGRAVEAADHGAGNSDEENLIDLLTDLRHWAKTRRCHYAHADRRGTAHFAVERREEGAR